MQYLVEWQDGRKSDDPVDEDVLKAWAKQGELGPRDNVRSTLINNWKEAKDIGFLDEIFQQAKTPEQKQSEEQVTAEANKPGAGPKKTRPGLGGGTFKYHPASYGVRLGAFVTDTLLLSLVVFIPVIAAILYTPEDIRNTPEFCYGAAAALFALPLIYFTGCVAFRAQTLGQQLFGIMVVHADAGEPVMGARAFCFALIHILTWWATPGMAFVTPTHRSVTGLLTNTRTIKVKGARC